jgi:hypothetical protein
MSAEDGPRLSVAERKFSTLSAYYAFVGWIEGKKLGRESKPLHAGAARDSTVKSDRDQELRNILFRPLFQQHPAFQDEEIAERLDELCRICPRSNREELKLILTAAVPVVPRARQEQNPSFLFRFHWKFAPSRELWKQTEDGKTRHVADSSFISAYFERQLISWLDGRSGNILEEARRIVKSSTYDGVINFWFVANAARRDAAAKAIRRFYGQRKRNLPRIWRIVEVHRVKTYWSLQTPTALNVCSHIRSTRYFTKKCDYLHQRYGAEWFGVLELRENVLCELKKILDTSDQKRWQRRCAFH